MRLPMLCDTGPGIAPNAIVGSIAGTALERVVAVNTTTIRRLWRQQRRR